MSEEVNNTVETAVNQIFSPNLEVVTINFSSQDKIVHGMDSFGKCVFMKNVLRKRRDKFIKDNPEATGADLLEVLEDEDMIQFIAIALMDNFDDSKPSIHGDIAKQVHLLKQRFSGVNYVRDAFTKIYTLNFSELPEDLKKNYNSVLAEMGIIRSPESIMLEVVASILADEEGIKKVGAERVVKELQKYLANLLPPSTSTSESGNTSDTPQDKSSKSLPGTEPMPSSPTPVSSTPTLTVVSEEPSNSSEVSSENENKAYILIKDFPHDIQFPDPDHVYSMYQQFQKNFPTAKNDGTPGTEGIWDDERYQAFNGEDDYQARMSVSNILWSWYKNLTKNGITWESIRNTHIIEERAYLQEVYNKFYPQSENVNVLETYRLFSNMYREKNGPEAMIPKMETSTQTGEPPAWYLQYLQLNGNYETINAEYVKVRDSYNDSLLRVITKSIAPESREAVYSELSIGLS